MCGATLSAQELRDTAQALWDLAGRISGDPIPGKIASRQGRAIELRSQDLGALAQRIYDQRSVRSRYWSDDLFGEPAWDIMLDLYVACANREMRSVKGAAIASRCPHTTALRYVQLLEKGGLIGVSDHLEDKRVRLVELTEKGRELMAGYLSDYLAQDKDLAP